MATKQALSLSVYGGRHRSWLRRSLGFSFQPDPLLQPTNAFCSFQSTNPSIHLQSLQRIHAHLLASSRKLDRSFIAKLIHAHCRAGNMDDARKLFDEMPEKNVVSFSTMISGYANNGSFGESLRLFSQMQELGICPNSFTVVAVLVSSARLGVLTVGECVHGRIIKSGLESSSFVRTAMLDCYAKCGSPGRSFKLFKEIFEPSLVNCNAMIAGFVHNGLVEDALLLFKQLGAFGMIPNSLTMMSVAQSCIGYVSFGLSESVHGYAVKLGLDLDVSVMNSVFNMYLSFGDLEIAVAFFERLDVMDVVTWTTMMGFLLELDHASDALDLFSQMRASAIDPDMVAMVNAVTACALLEDLKRGRLIHNQIVIRGFWLEVPIMNSLITLYSRCGDLGSARMSFDHIEDKSLISWTALISGYIQNRQPIEGLWLLIRMRREENFDIDSVTMLSSITASSELASFNLSKQLHAHCFKSGLLICKSVQNSLVVLYGKCGSAELARRVFDDMSCLDIVSWNAVISSYGINGEGEAALALFKDMEKHGEEPDSVTYLNVLTACSHSGLVNDGLQIFERMVKENRIAASGEHFGCVMDMLARAGRLEDARKLVSCMSNQVGQNVWKALLGGCHLHSEIELAEAAARKVFQTDTQDSGHLVLLSNAYASVGKFEKVESLRSSLGKKDLIKNTGFSLLEAMPCDNG